MAVSILRPFRWTSQTSEYRYDVALGLRSDKTTWNKFGLNTDIDTGVEEIIASFGGAFDPTTDIMTTAQTFTIAYNNTTDGDGNTGALSLLFTYLDENFLTATGIHTLGSTGSDVTSFTGLGINRVVVLSSGSAGFNNNAITITATTDTTTQAQIPANDSVTQQCIFHTDIGKSFLADWLYMNVGKAGGGGDPEVIFHGYSWSRVTQTRYEVFRAVFDESKQNFAILNPSQPFLIGGREVLYWTAETDTNNTEVKLRFSGVQRNSDGT